MMLPEIVPEKAHHADLSGHSKAVAAAPCDLFRRVQKRDGTLVDFNRSKIAECIFKAAQAVGGKDRGRAQTLAEYVILDLGRRHNDTTRLLNVEEIQDSIERVLVENGHYRTGRAYITYRNERARRRALRGEGYYPPTLTEDQGSLRDVSVWTSSGDRIRWDRERIVKALVRETRLSYEEARKVSCAVEMEIVHSKISRLTAPLIRELTNAQLLQLNYEKERRLHSRLGLPIYDVEQRLVGGGTDSARSVESEILRQFATEKVLPLSVTDKHGALDLHVHDLDSIHRPLELILEPDPIVTGDWPLSPPEVEASQESAWERFLTDWEREETQLLRITGKRLVWRNANASIAFHAHSSGVDSKTAARASLSKLRRLAGRGGSPPSVVWRLETSVSAHWRSKFIGAQQLSLLPGDEIEALVRGTLLEILQQVAEGGPFWVSCGVEFEVVLEPASKGSLDSDVAAAIAFCLSEGVPLRVLFRRETPVSSSADSENCHLLQTISLNFPRAALIAEGEDDRLIEWLEDRLVPIAEAHRAKRDLIALMLKSGSLAPLSSLENPSDGGIPLKLSDALFGVGVWGLEEMARIHRGHSPSENEETLRWVLKILARLKLRMEEIGKQSGIRMRMTSLADEGIVARLSSPLYSSRFDLGSTSSERDGFFQVSGSGSESNRREGMVHSFLAFGHASVTADFGAYDSQESLIALLNELAADTHARGLAMVGSIRLCRRCGAKPEGKVSVCPDCGSETVYELERKEQGTKNRIARL